MDEFRGIRVVTTGSKYETEQGFTAIKNGVKARASAQALPSEPKPPWLKVRIPSGERFESLRSTVRAHRLATVCEESICPNIGECWNNGTATLMLMGAVCTRACKYVVLTSVDRDDLPDGGAAHYAACIRAIKQACSETAVEALTPDFAGNLNDVETVVASGLDVFAQNVETVKRLTSRVRDARAGYAQTLSVLAHAKRLRPNVLTKTSLMLGLGETEDEILETLDDLKRISVDIVTFGQYLRPTPNHLPVERYVTPQEFEQYRQWGLASGFLEVVAGPLVRSSYRADRVFEKNNVGLGAE
jgi:lipoic acid synthetase